MLNHLIHIFTIYMHNIYIYIIIYIYISFFRRGRSVRLIWLEQRSLSVGKNFGLAKTLIPSHNKVEWPWRYRSRSKVITCNTPSHASDHLYPIWKESMQNCRPYRADTIFKVKAEWPWKYRSRSKVITCDTPSDAIDDLCQKWKEHKQNCRFFFMAKAEKLAKNWNFIILL